MELTKIEDKTKHRRAMSREAISLALDGNWERAIEVNRNLLDLFDDDVESMNRLGKALMEIGRYNEAGQILEHLTRIAPYNSIAKRNMARLNRLAETPAPSKQIRKTGGEPRLFIEESGKSGTTILLRPAAAAVVAHIAPGDFISLFRDKHIMSVSTREEEYLGQIEPRLSRRLIRLLDGGNQYEAAIISANERGICIIIRETYCSPTLRDVCSFPSKGKEEHRFFLESNLFQYIEEADEDGREARVEDAVEIDSDWND
jgi:tetratricopeptide (TPR) repeat protein